MWVTCLSARCNEVGVRDLLERGRTRDAGADGVDADAERGELDGELAHMGLEGGFSGRHRAIAT